MKEPSRSQYEDFLIQLVYGSSDDYLQGCLKSAYLDVCRTLHEFGKHGKKKEILKESYSTLTKQLQKLKKSADEADQESFDKWHRDTSESIIKIFLDKNFNSIRYGQTQKWINMTLKNIFVCGPTRISGYKGIYKFCHMPIDNIILDVLQKNGDLQKMVMINRQEAWSKWECDKYIEFQKALKEHFNNQPLLNVEFHLWLKGKELERSKYISKRP
jgi:hypothetical protein